MKLNEFYEAYNLYEMEIIKIYSKDGFLNILINCDTHLDLMGNGIRPSFDVSYHHLFKFPYDKLVRFNKIIVDEYKYQDGKIYLKINGKDIILDKDPEVVLNYE